MCVVLVVIVVVIVVAAAGVVAVFVVVLWRQVISVFALDFSHVQTTNATEKTSEAVIS